ncbi:multidrug effflux MFS transporter [Sphingomicrobium clamense]|uniref:Multidrug effflux MFS transporter n=1 Tax=Sphingomicrobium clamense TaxID=2851013 RepID=A0ABS6V641_9SPHN|nr:multidrug effflux MFS transporter [Sphingomicrobium sp. B8]MBW0145006.1 multidrug effflux MFS transporter [Sphingomicrobium sp. B8]
MDAPTPPVRRETSTREIVALLAAFMAINAFALDAMLPALPAIGDDLGALVDNQRQWVIVAYTFGFGFSQMLWGPLADRFGRKPVMAWGVALYFLFAMACALARDFDVLVASRFMMGAAGAVSRVLVIAIVRDLFEKEEMARVMSLTFMVFMVVPVIAPTVGIAILQVGSWRWIFAFLGLWGLFVLLWGQVRLPETLHPEWRRALDAGAIWRASKRAMKDRLSMGYTLALTFVFSVLIGYLASIQQILGQVFERPEALGWVFAAIAAPMGVASWGNSRIVTRFGLRRVGHTGILVFAVSSVAHLGWHVAFGSTLTSFIAFMAVTLTAFAFSAANFGTLAMTNMAPIAGTASSVQGTIGTIGGASIGALIGQAYDGSVLPFIAASAACGMVALAIVLVTERGRLFHTPPEEQDEASA